MKKVIIIGAGPGGYTAAVCLAKANCKVVLIENALPGGTCLNAGCIPTKVLLDHTSLFEHFLNQGGKKKIFSGEIKIDIENLKTFQKNVINELGTGLSKLLKKRNIEVVTGEAKLITNTKVQVINKENSIEIEGDEIIIATGSRPNSIPSFNFDKKLILSSDDVWNIPEIPKDLLIIGSGPIGIEFARIYSALGSKVTISEIKEKICPILDNEISETLARSLKKRNIILKPNVASKFLEKKESFVIVEFISTIDTEREVKEFNQVLIAVGRKPNTENLGLEKAGVDLEPQGFIKVNEYLKTGKQNIHAIGDVTNFPQLAHTASFQARVVSENITHENKKTFDARFIPSCIFGYPEIAFVGETEEALKEKKVDYKVGKCFFITGGKAKASGLTDGLVKILMDKNTKQISGAHIIGPEASNLIHELVIAMQNNISVDKIASSIHAHPTYSEVVLEALEDCLGEAIHA